VNEQADKPAREALACAIVGLLLWLLSYLWVPLSLIPTLLEGRDLSFLAPILPLSEAGALLIATIGIGFGVEARRRSQSGSAEHRSASRRLALNMLLPVLVIVPNIVFPLLLGR
jgi:hypothetical protein